MNSQPTDIADKNVAPGTPGYVDPEAYKAIVDAQMAMIAAYMSAQQ